MSIEDRESFRYCTFGGLGSGKTICLVRDALRYHQVFPSLPIFSNIELRTIPFKRVDSASVLFELDEPCYLLLDELWHLVDSRRSLTLVNDILSMLLLRSRKKRWRVGYSEQFISQLDIRVRYITDLWGYPSIDRRNWVLTEKLYSVDHLTEQPVFIRDRRFFADDFFEEFYSERDPFTLNISELKMLWHRYRRDRGLV